MLDKFVQNHYHGEQDESMLRSEPTTKADSICMFQDHGPVFMLVGVISTRYFSIASPTNTDCRINSVISRFSFDDYLGESDYSEYFMTIIGDE